jgi:hypothetical protein
VKLSRMRFHMSCGNIEEAGVNPADQYQRMGYLCGDSDYGISAGGQNLL